MSWLKDYSGLWKIAFKRLIYDPILTLCLLTGWTVCIALMAALPMYTDAVNQYLLRQELQASRMQSQSTFPFFYHFVGGSAGGTTWERYQAMRQYMAAGLSAELGLPARTQTHAVKSDLLQIFPVTGGSYSLKDSPLLRGYVGFVEQIEDHITIIEGQAPVPPPAAEAPVEVLVSQEIAQELGFQVGERYVLFDPGGPSADGQRRRIELPVRIAGIWVARDAQAEFWYGSPANLNNVFLVPETSYIASISTAVPHAFFDLSWYQVFDGDHIRAEDVPAFLRRVSAVDSQISMLLPGTFLEHSPISALKRYQRTASSQAILLLQFSIPILGLILYFIILIADSAVKRQAVEIAMMKSRGATRGQILGIFLFQGLTLGLVSLATGLLLGTIIAQAIGSTRHFLDFQARMPLNIAITAESWRFTLLALGLALGATILPAISASRVTIISAKQAVGRSLKRPFWQRAFLDIVLLSIAGYGYYLLETQGRIALLQSDPSGDPFSNPLLFLAPALFIFSIALFSIRVFQGLTQALSWLSTRSGGVSLLLALHNLARSSQAYSGVLLLLILTTSLGTFTASMARTLDENLVARTFYRIGADMALTEGVSVRTLDETGDAAESPEQIEADPASIWISLPVDDHRRAPGVQAATRMGEFDVSTRVGNRVVPGTLYGIDRVDFAQVAYFRPDFAPASLGALMNALAVEPSGVIVSQSLLDESGLRVGDTLLLRGLIPTSNEAVSFKIAGAVSLFPTAYPQQNGQEQAIFIANLDYIFFELGQELPYKVWLATDETVELAVLAESLADLGFKVLSGQDARALIAEAQERPERIGLFGFLSIGFIIITVLSMLTLAIYAFLSIRQRFIQLGILRAIGLSRLQLASSLGSEQVLITTIGIGLGAYLGLLSSALFIPFLQIGYSQTDLVPPFIVLIAWNDVIKIVLALVAVLFLTTAGIIWLLMQLKTFQAVKMGEAFL